MNKFNMFINNNFGGYMIRDDYNFIAYNVKNETEYYTTLMEKINNSKISLTHTNRFCKTQEPLEHLTFTDCMVK